MTEADYTAIIEERDEAIANLSAQLDEARRIIAVMQDELRLERARQYAPKSERAVVVGQVSMDLGVAAAEDAGEGETEEVSYTRRKPGKRGRSNVNANTTLPVEVVDVFPEGYPDVKCDKHRAPLRKMGCDVRRTLEHQPEKWYVKETRIWKMTCPECSNSPEGATIVRAEAPAPLIPGSTASASAVSAIIEKRFVDATPFYRQEASYERRGVGLSRQTMVNWVMAAASAYFMPIYALLHRLLLEHDLLHADETTCSILNEPGRKATQKSYAWLYRTGSDAGHPIVLYDPQPTRGHEAPASFLAGWSGWLQVDGWDAYKKLEEAGGVRVVGCWAHARRKLTDAVKAYGGKGRACKAARRGLALVNELFKIEREAAKESSDPERILAVRRERAVPALLEIKRWMAETGPGTMPESALGKAIAYMGNQWPYLVRYVEDGRLECSNNRAERAIRPVVVSRKNSLFNVSVEGAAATFAIYSVIETAKENGCDPGAYVRFLLEAMPGMPEGADLAPLLPWGEAVPDPVFPKGR